MMTIVGMVLICGGVFFLLTGAVGLIRFPDIYTRMHAAGKCDTLGRVHDIIVR
jgi:multicomponent Na+:H+ antiporter subunit G